MQDISLIDLIPEDIYELVYSGAWPESVPSSLICCPDSQEQLLIRADGILENYVNHNLKGKKFLDFGCGTAHVAMQACKQDPELSVGYDILDSSWHKLDKINQFDNLILTTEFSVVEQHGPYDYILLFDVIDHLDNCPLNLFLSLIKKVCKKGGRIIVRSHPWTARHGGHLFHIINRAYLHLILNDDEIRRLVEGVQFHLSKVSKDCVGDLCFPIVPSAQIIPDLPIFNFQLYLRILLRNLKRQYVLSKHMKKAIASLPNCLQAQSRVITKDLVEDFFIENQIIRKRILKNLSLSPSAPLPISILEQSYIDYVISI
jgi:SAM-dependent methyltransferase